MISAGRRIVWGGASWSVIRRSSSCTARAPIAAGGWAIVVKYLATVMQFPKKMAEQGVDAVVAFSKDGTKPSGFQDTGAQLITDKPLPGLESKDTAWGAQNCWG